MSKKVTEFRIVDHGIERSDSFQGHGIAFTSWADCATGCGETPEEALCDALDDLTEQGWDMERIVGSDEYWKIMGSSNSVDHSECPDGCDHYWYVSVDVK